MIVKNEEENIVNCLDCAMKVVDEAIVVDTGSTDKTVDLLNKYSNENKCVKIIHHRWENNFSKARNISMQYATGDWIIILDADERLFADRIKLDSIINNTMEQAFIIPIYNLMNNDNIEVTSVMVRLFKNNKPYYHGAIHEQLNIDNKNCVGKVMESNICKIYHYGYYKSVYDKKNKEKRNMDIIKKQIKIEPNNPFHWYNKGVMEMIGGNYETAIDDFLKCNKLTNKRRYSFHDNLILELIKCMMALKNYNQIISLVNDISKDIYIGKIPDIYYYCGIAYANIEQHDLAIEHFKKAINIGEYEKGVSRYGTGSFLAKIQWSKVLLLQNKKNESIDKLKEAVLDNINVQNVGIEELIVLLKEEKREYEIKRLEQIINNKNTHDTYLDSEFFKNKDNVKNNITTLVENGNLEAAKELILGYEKVVNDDIDIYSIKGVIAMMEGKMDDAEKIFKEGISKDENYFDLLYNIAYLYQYNKQNKLAIAYYEKSLYNTSDKISIDKINDSLNSLYKSN
jgi:glycosyltransferase involved in cell wall biosynthesis